jgi:hypothetical protein
MKRTAKHFLIGCLVACLATSCAWPPSMMEDSAKVTPKYSKKAAAPTGKVGR